MCGFGSSLNVAIQIAVKEGYGPLYLLGCDLGYKDGGRNHFDGGYDKGLEDHLRPAELSNADITWAHNIALKSCPVPIFNCTRGGKLEVFPRQKLEDVLRGDQNEV